MILCNNPPGSAAFVVHNVGTAVQIDRNKRTIGIIYPGQTEPRELVSLDESFVQQYLKCRVCGAELSDDRVAVAFWRHQTDVCSTECLRKETLRRYACCEKAQPRGCVCAYSTSCPDHGIRCYGTHD